MHTLDSTVDVTDILTTTAQRTLVHTLERLGWSLTSAEVDLVTNAARIELRRVDGLLVTLDARYGTVSITRERVRVEVKRMGRIGDRYRAGALRTDFLGRTRHEGIRSGLRALANYVEDNATTAAPRFTARPAFAALLA